MSELFTLNFAPTLFVDGFDGQYTTIGDIAGIMIDGPADDNQVVVGGNVLGDVINDDGWYNQIDILGAIVGDLVISDTYGGKFTAWSVNDVDFDNTNGTMLKLGFAGTYQSDDTTKVDVEIDFLAYGKVDDSQGDRLSFSTVADQFEVDDSHNLELHFDDLEGNLEIDDTKDFSVIIENSDGGDVTVKESEGTIEVREGGVELVVDDSDVGVIGSDGDDEFEFTDSDVVANLGGGNDYGEVDGGRTLINTIDGEEDEIVYRADGGGRHEVHVGKFDFVAVKTDVGLFSADHMDAFDGQLDGRVEYGDFELAVVSSEQPYENGDENLQLVIDQLMGQIAELESQLA